MSESKTDELFRLKEAVENAAVISRRSYVLHLVISIYIILIVASTSDIDILLGSDVELPLLNIKVSLKLAYIIASPLYILYHCALFMQLYFLAKKTHGLRSYIEENFDSSQIKILQDSVYPFLLGQAIADRHIKVDERDQAFSKFLLTIMSTGTLIVLPLIVLLSVQIKFLSYQSEFITMIHKASFFGDLLLIWLFVPKIMSAGRDIELLQRKGAFYFVSSAIGIILILFSSLVLTVPMSQIDMFLSFLDSARRYIPRNVVLNDTLLVRQEPPGEIRAHYLKMPPEGDEKEAWARHAQPINLRKRSLISAEFKRAILDRADFSNANLTQADFSGARLQRARFASVIASHVVFENAELQYATFLGADLKDASLRFARLNNADLQNADLRRGYLDSANLSGAKLKGSDLTSTKFQNAILSGADLSNAVVKDANFYQADLSDADLSCAQLSGSDLSTATGLTQKQLNQACGDDQTELPPELHIKPCDNRCLPKF